jgi:hypothetical protein
MTGREITGVELAALKTASRALVTMLGGLEAAALVCRYNAPALSEACSLHRTDRSLPLDVVADLERAAGQPVVTRVMARLQRQALVPMLNPGTAEARAIAALFRQFGAVSETYAAAMEDAVLSPAERQALADGALALSAACQQAAATLLAPREKD